MKYLSLFLSLILLASWSTIGFSANGAATAIKTDSTPAKKAETSTSTISSKNNDPAPGTPYTIQPGDMLLISVWKEKDLEKEVLVRADGKISFPLIGDITAGGLTYKEFQKDLIDKLSRYIPHPSVTISATRPLGNKLFVVGKVNKPGEIVNVRNLDVMQALSIAGGLNTFASEKKIKILRRVNGKLIAIPFNYKAVKKGKKLEQNIILQSGDVIVVR